eukprot:CAMPEP_0185020064 /NCGR_PEP_ID=MMETSP1103-20130426/2649_1 /TAXON_ID=36769 /ORGANISM="Paraphysomonas bandaiensis, Strain Caron Lab Isolate" /LENGTH=325 /DNA_ID=CAMNT_0027550717 /DNA_START=40 /DNA_END=1017 /DNA_ORIENTATION=-
MRKSVQIIRNLPLGMTGYRGVWRGLSSFPVDSNGKDSSCSCCGGDHPTHQHKFDSFTAEKKNSPVWESVRSFSTTTDSFDSVASGALTGNDDTYTTYDGETIDISNVEDPDIAKLLQNNRDWVEREKNSDPNFFKKIGAKQVPKYLYIGCSDSRVPANQILGLGPGEVFVHRNVGNLVIGSDLNVLSVVEFAVNVLEVQHIIVTGHYDCGAVRAAMTTQDLGLLENWIRHIRDVHRMHHSSMDMISDDELRHKRLVELSVIEQCVNLFKIAAVQKKRKEYYGKKGSPVFPKVHAMVFDPKVGLLKKLPVNFKNIIRNYQHIYNLY